MTLTRWDPFREMVSLREVMNRLFDESFVHPLGRWSERAEGEFAVSMDMYETDDNLNLDIDLPGLSPEDVDVTIHENRLTVKGEYKADEEGKRGDVRFRERRYGKFQRSVTLPSSVNTDATEAEFQDGVLKLTLPKAEEAKPKQISIKS
jgi:HSP20 family protein